MKAMYHHELAAKAGVCTKTFSRWLEPLSQELQAMGLEPGMHLIPPHVVEYLAHRFCIDVEAKPKVLRK